MRIKQARRSHGQVVAVVAVLVGAAIAAPSAFGETYQRAPVPRDQLPYLPQLERFLEAVERADIGTAVDALEWTGDASSKLKQQLATAATSLGKPDGHEIIAVRRISPRLHQLYGVIHYEKQPLLFVLHPRYFRGMWKIQTVTFTADPKGLNDLAPLEPVAPASDQKVAGRF
jgi:hypothetical protein